MFFCLVKGTIMNDYVYYYDDDGNDDDGTEVVDYLCCIVVGLGLRKGEG